MGVVELVQFRRKQTGYGGPPRIEYRQAQVVVGPNGHILLNTDDDGRPIYGPWRPIPRG